MEKSLNANASKVSFFRLILIPFFVITMFSEFYSNAFLMAFLVDNRPALELVKKNPDVDLFELLPKIQDSRAFKMKSQGAVTISQRDGETKAQVSGDFFAAGLRLLSLIILYLWLRPFFAYVKSGNDSLKEKATNRYNNFYSGIFSYFLLAHLIWFFSSTFRYCLPENLGGAMVYHLVWYVIECYLFYLFLEPTLFMYVSGLFVEPGFRKPSRTSLSIYGKLLTMLVFLMLLPLAILAAFIHKEYIIIGLYQSNALILIATSAAFLIGNLQLLYKSVQEPIDYLVEKMQKLADGDFNVQTSVLFDDEIGRLKLNFNMMVGQLKERDEIKDTFGKYVSIEIARHLIENRKVALGGENIVATILFSDIR
ncbi:MAG: HAMP domain-containing protein, partial [Candidatus Riflebacteria bacterium]